MSFADSVRRELIGIPVRSSCCRRALVCGLLVGAIPNSEKPEAAVRYRQRETADFAATVFTAQYGKAPIRTDTGACGHLFCNLTLSSPSCRKAVTKMRAEGADAEHAVGFLCEGCRSAFLRGAFLATATVSDPHRSFHLEFLMPDRQSADLFGRFLDTCGYPPRETARPNGIGLYYKKSESVEELITLAGAHHILFDVINNRIERDIRNNENRATNCVARNIEKSVSAAGAQMEAITCLLEHDRLDGLPVGLRTTALLRYRNPDATLDELTVLHDPPISRSGLNHRLRKLLNLAEELSGKSH